MKQEMIGWIHAKLTQEKESHGGEFILVTVSDKGTGTIIIEASESMVATAVYHLVKGMSEEGIKALLNYSLSDTSSPGEDD
jgi:hypothetical protein